MLVFMFVFSFTAVNAGTISDTQEDSVACFEIADEAAFGLGQLLGFNHIQEYNVFISIYDNCVAAGN